MPPIKLALLAPATACCGDSTNTHAGLLEPSKTEESKEGKPESGSRSGSKSW